MARNYFLDTNVLLHDPTAPRNFKEHNVTIPITVLEEIDSFKREQDDRGRNAREVSRFLDGLRQKASLKEGVQLPGGGMLRVLIPRDRPQGPLDLDGNDNRILNLVIREAETSGDEVVLISRDFNMRIKADAAGIRCEDYRHTHVRVDLDDQFMGWQEQVAYKDEIGILSDWEKLPWEGRPHEFFCITDGGQGSVLAQMDKEGAHLKKIVASKKPCWGVLPRNREQIFALSALLNPDIHLVTLQGVAGTGKTLLALAAGLKQASDEGLYRKVLVARPIIPMGRDLGYLPGSMQEKLAPWMKPIMDNLETMIGKDSKRNAEELFQQGFLEVEALSYIRGRSIPQQYLIIDEAQNLSPHEVKTVLTRAGEGTKVVLTGDPHQIDSPFIDATSNGLTYATERFKDSPLAAHVTLKKGERSLLAEAASTLL
jgi:PhoH-like ATPase